MKLVIISFTKTGSHLNGKLVKRLRELGHHCQGYVQQRYLNEIQENPGLCPIEDKVGNWTKRWFHHVDGLIYIGAAGIAVRAIAPCLKDKMEDPAVVVMDEDGRYAISLLSGHVGGANELTNMVSEVTGSQPVITTASDVRGTIAIDVWAKKRGLKIVQKDIGKKVAAALLDEKPVGFYSDFPVTGGIPHGFSKGQLCEYHVWITTRIKPTSDHLISMFLSENGSILRLIPPVLTVGIGCRKGISEVEILKRLTQVFHKENLDICGVGQITSIEIKREEQGLIKAAKHLGIPFVTYSVAELEQVKGDFTRSAFVKSVTGTDNVCERAALAGAGKDGRLILSKQIGEGITIAIASSPVEIDLNVTS